MDASAPTWKAVTAPSWGVPDWHDGKAYPKHQSAGRWGWEFLRRNHEYRQFWTERIEPLVSVQRKNIDWQAMEFAFGQLADRFGLDLASCKFVGCNPRDAALRPGFLAGMMQTV